MSFISPLFIFILVLNIIFFTIMFTQYDIISECSVDSNICRTIIAVSILIGFCSIGILICIHFAYNFGSEH